MKMARHGIVLCTEEPFCLSFKNVAVYMLGGGIKETKG